MPSTAAPRTALSRMMLRSARKKPSAALIPTHYDDFFRPLGEDMDLVANVKLAALPGELRAVSRDVTVAALPRRG